MRCPLVTLGDCCEIVSGATPSTTVKEYWDGRIFWATPKDVSALEGHFISDTARKLTESGLASCAATILPPNSVLFSSRAPIGHVAVNTVPMATNQGFKSFVPKPDRIDAKFLFHWLRANRSYLESLGVGATFKEVSKTIISRVEIPLPSLPDQRHIATILDKADALCAQRRAAIAKLDELLQSVFIEMFGDPATNPKGWPMRKIADLLDSVKYGSSDKATQEGEIPILRMNNLTYSGQIELSDLKYITAKQADEKYLVEPGDILFNRTNSKELVGKTAVYDGPIPMAYAGYLVRGRVNQSNAPEYISAFLNSVWGKAILRNMCKNIVGMANINAREFSSIELPVPPSELQRKFQQYVRAVRMQKQRMQEGMKKLDELFACLQQRAFSGKL